MVGFLTKAFVAKQRSRLVWEKQKVLSDVAQLRADDPFADPGRAIDNAAVDTDVREQIGHDTIAAEIKDLERKLADIDHAISKIDKGSYGICERTGQVIPLPRLELVPEARFVVVEE